LQLEIGGSDLVGMARHHEAERQGEPEQILEEPLHESPGDDPPTSTVTS
jgi:hypothetical protein